MLMRNHRQTQKCPRSDQGTNLGGKDVFDSKILNKTQVYLISGSCLNEWNWWVFGIQNHLKS